MEINSSHKKSALTRKDVDIIKLIKTISVHFQAIDILNAFHYKSHSKTDVDIL